MSYFGVISPFNLQHGDFNEYMERLEQYFVAKLRTINGRLLYLSPSLAKKRTVYYEI